MEDYKVTHCLATIISDLKDDNRCLDDLINSKNNKRNEDSNKIAELQAEIKSLKADIIHDAKVCYDVDDEHIKIIDKLKAENKRLYQEHKECREDAVKHYPKEYKAEADEYFHHNPKGETLFFFIVGDDEIDEDGDVTRTLNVGCDAIAEIDNM